VILTGWINLRIGLIVIAAVLAQISFFSHFEVFGTEPDVVPVVIAALGLLGGAVAGAVVGFSAGLLLDVVLLETLGVSSLILLSVGYLAGRYRESFEIDSLVAPAAVTGALTFLAAAGWSAMELTLGVDSRLSAAVLGDAIVKALLAFLLAYPVYSLIRRALRPALVIDEVPGRRSTRTAPAARGRERRRRSILGGNRGKGAGGVRRARSRVRRAIEAGEAAR
jgi:rod shape-determining protein MreD